MGHRAPKGGIAMDRGNRPQSRGLRDFEYLGEEKADVGGGGLGGGQAKLP